MYYSFEVVNLQTNLKDKQIIVNYSMDINRNNTNGTVIEVFERASKSPVMFDDVISRDKIIITLRDWPIPNTEYVLSVKGVRSITDEETNKGLKTSFSFKSEVINSAKIIAPTNFEKIDEVLIKLKESCPKDKDEEEFINSFYIEIGLDNNFIDVPYKMFIQDKSEVVAGLRRYGQYYIRARVQKTDENEEIQYGEWSETSTFIYGDEKEDGGLPPIIDPDDPVEEPDLEPEVIDGLLELIGGPEPGMTPKSFTFEFSLPLNDIMVEEKIMIVKRRVK